MTTFEIIIISILSIALLKLLAIPHGNRTSLAYRKSINNMIETLENKMKRDENVTHEDILYILKRLVDL